MHAPNGQAGQGKTGSNSVAGLGLGRFRAAVEMKAFWLQLKQGRRQQKWLVRMVDIASKVA